MTSEKSYGTQLVGLYKVTEPWKNEINTLVNTFGVDNTYITEFGPSWSSLDTYSTDESVQAAAVTEMIDYIKASGIKRAFYFCLYGDTFGAIKDDGTYRLLWCSLLNSKNSLPEICNDGIDNDCDGLVDSLDPECASNNKWPGLSISVFHTPDPADFDSYVDDLLANGFDIIRVGSPDWTDEWNSINRAKAAVLRAQAKGAKVCWGVTQSFTITEENWPAFRQAILDAAQWAQDNELYEFKIGNEECYHNDDTTLTDAELIANLKDVATEVQDIYTIGKVSYSCWQGVIDDWIAADKGDIDILASNVYMGGEYDSYDDDWKLRIDKLVDAFGTDETYLTEFGPSYTSLEHYSTDESVQAAAVTEMIEYIKASGMKKASYFTYHDMDWLDGEFGARKIDGTYRQLWYSLLNSN